MKDGVRVLFICTHNSARSQMGEAFMNALGKGRFVAESAGFEPGPVNPVVIEVMKEIGYDLSKNRSKSVFEFFKQGRLFDHVITVCDDGAEGECPVFPGIASRIHRSFADPSRFQGTHEEVLEQTRHVRDEIKARVEEWVETLK